MIKNVVWTVVFGFIAAILQSTLLSHLALYRAVPDLALGIVVYSAYVNGVMAGQLSGFSYGIVLDLLSAAPLGLNAFIRTLIGALAGLMKGTFFLDAFLLPMILCAFATLFKALILFLLSLLFAGSVPAYPIIAPILWAELALNTFTAPFLFAFLKRFNTLLVGRGKT
uniref:Rod shape-determining protein MreD n=1 Tax=uncultured bacterium contig00061 TaxID=1181544 RepID=A0A806JYW4_9BACT|nr:rod shape-determining protein MreD [uncultured bacterium contig00061]